MFKKGTRVVIVDEAKAKEHGARVANGEKGTIGKPRGSPDYINVHIDGDKNPLPWAMVASCAKRIRKAKQRDYESEITQALKQEPRDGLALQKDLHIRADRTETILREMLKAGVIHWDYERAVWRVS